MFKNFMTSKKFQSDAIKVLNFIENYLNELENFPVLSQTIPDEIKNNFPYVKPPYDGKSIEDLLEDFEKYFFRGITHWNHPGFMAYFNSTSSEAGILSEFLIAAMNLNGMLWKTSPVVTELENIVVNWLREMIGLNENFWGIIYDTASISTFHAIASAREQLNLNIRGKGIFGRNDLPKIILYCSEHAHSSIDKSAIALGIGTENVRKIKTNKKFEMIPDELLKAIENDKKSGYLPFCVVATIGTTSFASNDPIKSISEICNNFNIWLHIDAAYAGVAAILPEMKWITNGWNDAESIVINPHKWMFTPIDCSILLTKKKFVLKNAFSIVSDYLRTKEENQVNNLMDYGLQLGRRFRALKLWFVISNLGVKGIEEKIRNHIKWAKEFSEWIENHKYLKLIAPVHFSTICFQLKTNEMYTNDKINEFNLKLLDLVNSSGKIFISNTMLNNQIILRLTIGSYWQEKRHIEMAKQILNECIEKVMNN